MSRPRGRAIAARTPSAVISRKTTRSTGLSPSASFSRSQVSTCQAIASPSRSGSVARISPSESPSAARIAPSARAARRPAVSYTIAKPSSGVTEPAFAGRSRTWPWQASTRQPRPRNRSTVRALAGDSTTTTRTPRLTARPDRRHRRPPRARPAPEPAFAASPRGRGLSSDPSRHRPACRPSAGAHPLRAGLR